MILTIIKFDRILVWSKLKAFADDKMNMTEKMKFVLGKAKKMCET